MHAARATRAWSASSDGAQFVGVLTPNGIHQALRASLRRAAPSAGRHRPSAVPHSVTYDVAQPTPRRAASAPVGESASHLEARRIRVSRCRVRRSAAIGWPRRRAAARRRRCRLGVADADGDPPRARAAAGGPRRGHRHGPSRRSVALTVAGPSDAPTSRVTEPHRDVLRCPAASRSRAVELASHRSPRSRQLTLVDAARPRARRAASRRSWPRGRRPRCRAPSRSRRPRRGSQRDAVEHQLGRSAASRRVCIAARSDPLRSRDAVSQRAAARRPAKRPVSICSGTRPAGRRPTGRRPRATAQVGTQLRQEVVIGRRRRPRRRARPRRRDRGRPPRPCAAACRRARSRCRVAHHALGVTRSRRRVLRQVHAVDAGDGRRRPGR